MYPWHCVMCQYQVDGQAIKKMYETHGNLRLTDHWSLGHKNGPRLPPAQLPQPWVTAVVSTWIPTDASRSLKSSRTKPSKTLLTNSPWCATLHVCSIVFCTISSIPIISLSKNVNHVISIVFPISPVLTEVLIIFDIHF